MLPALLSAFVFLLSANAQYRFDCYEDVCTTKGNECPTFKCEKNYGRTVQNVTECGCCPLCIKNLNEGDQCATEYHGWIRGITECGPGLTCEPTEGKKGICVKSECAKRLENYKTLYSSTERPPLKVTFECDHFGRYEPFEDSPEIKPCVVCIDDVLCFCVDKNGKRIFGTDFAVHNKSESNMDCNCSRDINDFPKEVDPEKLPRCLPNGNYDPLQCVHNKMGENKCFCMESTRLYEDEVIDKIAEIEHLTCYDKESHKNNRVSECLQKREEQIKYIKKKNATGIGVDLIRCELDGAYYPLQCKKGRCYCATSNGEIQHNYEDVGKDDGEIICRCLRDIEVIKSYRKKKTRSMEIFQSINCRTFESGNNILPLTFVSDFIKK